MTKLWVIEKCNVNGKELVKQGYSESLIGKWRARHQYNDQASVYIQRHARETDDLTDVPSVVVETVMILH